MTGIAIALCLVVWPRATLRAARWFLRGALIGTAILGGLVLVWIATNLAWLAVAWMLWLQPG